MNSLASKMKDLPDVTPVVRGIMKEQRISLVVGVVTRHNQIFTLLNIFAKQPIKR